MKWVWGGRDEGPERSDTMKVLLQCCSKHTYNTSDLITDRVTNCEPKSKLPSQTAIFQHYIVTWCGKLKASGHSLDNHGVRGHWTWGGLQPSPGTEQAHPGLRPGWSGLHPVGTWNPHATDARPAWAPAPQPGSPWGDKGLLNQLFIFQNLSEHW